MQYHKIQTIFKRDPETNYKTLLEGEFSEPHFEYLKDNPWMFTEKVDVTNIRLGINGGYRVGGRTDNAQIPPFLLDEMQAIGDRAASILDDDTTLYGEGFGARIQKGGGNYIADGVGFVLFDVLCGGLWLERENVEDISHKIGIGCVPVFGRGPLVDAINSTRAGFESRWGSFAAEGLVMRPTVELLNRRGHRVIAKIKHKDFPK